MGPRPKRLPATDRSQIAKRPKKFTSAEAPTTMIDYDLLADAIHKKITY